MIRRLWRALFPSYKCGYCRDTGILSDGYAMCRCHYCRDLNAEIRAAKKKFWGEFGEYVKEQKP